MWAQSLPGMTRGNSRRQGGAALRAGRFTRPSKDEREHAAHVPFATLVPCRSKGPIVEDRISERTGGRP
jgi:hypothetical protein